MKAFKLNNDGDVSIVNNEIEMIKGTDEVLQQIRQIFRSNQGEWYFNPEYGLNYENLLAKEPNLDLIRDEIKNGLSQCSRVMSIDYVTVNYDRSARKLYVDFQATDTEGNEIAETNLEV